MKSRGPLYLNPVYIDWALLEDFDDVMGVAEYEEGVLEECAADLGEVVDGPCEYEKMGGDGT